MNRCEPVTECDRLSAWKAAIWPVRSTDIKSCRTSPNRSPPDFRSIIDRVLFDIVPSPLRRRRGYGVFLTLKVPRVLDHAPLSFALSQEPQCLRSSEILQNPDESYYILNICVCGIWSFCSPQFPLAVLGLDLRRRRHRAWQLVTPDAFGLLRSIVLSYGGLFIMFKCIRRSRVLSMARVAQRHARRGTPTGPYFSLVDL